MIPLSIISLLCYGFSMSNNELSTQEVFSGNGPQGRQEVQAQDHAGATAYDAGRENGKKKSGRIPANLTGMRFGMLIAIHGVGMGVGRGFVWTCLCDCGAETAVRSGDLRNGTKSCGCLRRRGSRRTHGHSKTKLYQLWFQMIYRCENPNSPAFFNYGGRGIKVCERWHKFENFYEDMGPRPDGKTLDRKDNDGDYCKENCRWATCFEQANNRRVNLKYTMNGVTRTLNEWCGIAGLKYSTVYMRIKSYGWAVEEALTTKLYA